MEELYKAISEICNEKAAKGIAPVAALYSEIFSRVSMPHDKVKDALNGLVGSGKVKWYRTLNQTSFEIIKQKK